MTHKGLRTKSETELSNSLSATTEIVSSSSFHAFLYAIMQAPKLRPVFTLWASLDGTQLLGFPALSLVPKDIKAGQFGRHSVGSSTPFQL